MKFKYFFASDRLTAPGRRLASDGKLFCFLVLAIILTLGLTISFQSLLAAWTAPVANPPACAAGDPGCGEPAYAGNSNIWTAPQTFSQIITGGMNLAGNVINTKTGVSEIAVNYNSGAGRGFTVYNSATAPLFRVDSAGDISIAQKLMVSGVITSRPTLAGDPAETAATKGYVDARLAGCFDLFGSQITSYPAGSPTADLNCSGSAAGGCPALCPAGNISSYELPGKIFEVLEPPAGGNVQASRLYKRTCCY